MLAGFDEIQQGLQLVQAAVAALRVVAAALQQGLEGLFLGDMVSQRAISKADVAISAGAASLGRSCRAAFCRRCSGSFLPRTPAQ